MKRRKVFVGEKFGEWVVLKDLGTIKEKRFYRFVEARCSCGIIKHVYFGSLFSGRSTNCGCIRNKRIKENITTHGMSRTRLHRIWGNMKQRCYNKNNHKYYMYGARGITVCDEWLNDFMTFYNWSTNNGYSDNLTIDRIDNDKGYSPDNCRWATAHMQSVNQRMKSNNKSGYTGVYWCNTWKIWKSYIRVNKKSIFIGSFKNKEDAVIARDEFIIKNNLDYKIQKKGV